MPSTSHTSKTMGDVFTDLLSKKRALLVSYLEFLNTFSHVYTSNQTNLSIITPTPGRKLCVHAVILATDGNTGNAELDFASSGKPVARLYASRFQQHLALDLHIPGNVDEPLTLNTTTGATNVFVAVSYVEES